MKSLVRLSPEISWRQWDDGIAVFVHSTCETHLLSPQLAPLFSAEGDAPAPVLADALLDWQGIDDDSISALLSAKILVAAD